MLKWRMADADPASTKLARAWRLARWLVGAGVMLGVLASAALMLWPPERADALNTWNARVEIYTSFRDIDGDGNNDYNPQFTVTLTRTAGAAATCPSPITLRPRIGSAGADGSNGNQIIAGATHTADDLTQDCEYSVGWDSSGVLTGVTGDDGSEVDLSRIGGDNRISAGDPVANRIFRDKSLEGPGTLSFDPPLTAAPAGTMFEVRYVATSASPAACRLPAERDSETYTIGANGVPTETASERWVNADDFSLGMLSNGFNFGMLLNRPAHGGGSCRYTLDLPDIEGYTKPTNPPTVTSNANVTVSYSAIGAQNFQPSLTFTVPTIDVDSTAGRDFVGATFRVTYSRSGGPDMGCTPSTTSYTWTLDSSGVVQPPADNDVVDVPAGLDPPVSCEYTVNFSQNASQGYTRAGNPADNTISAADNAAAATYETRSTTFDATFAITGPTPVEHPAHGEGIRVSPANQRTVSWSYARQTSASMHCSADAAVNLSEQFRAQGTISTDVTGLVDLPRGYTTLADRCVYDITWNEEVPAIANADLSFTPFGEHGILLADSPTPSATFSGAMPNPTASYELSATPFEPNINIAVPAANADGTSNSLFAGTTFALSYAKTATSHPDCSPNGTQDYVVRNNGTVSPDVQAGDMFELVDVPRGETVSCVYQFNFPPDAASASGAPVTWELTRRGNATANVNADSNLSRQYLPSADIEFAPSITLAVPQVDIDGTAGNDFAGTASGIRLTVARASGPSTGCSSASPDYVISDAGVAEPAEAGLMFVSVPADNDTECVYTVTFPTNNQDRLLVRKTESSDDDTFSGSDSAAMATYETAERPFTATFTAAAPTAADGESLALTVTQAASTHENCLATFDVTVAIGADGTGRTTRANVADWPRGYTVATDRCSYDVAWPYAETVTGGALATLRRTAGTATVNGPTGDAAATAEATYVTNAFQPAIAIDAPVVDVDGTAGNDFTDAQFALSIGKPGQHADCSAGGPVTYVIADDGSVSPSATTPVPTLIDIPEGQRASCVYTVMFPGNDNGGSLVLKTESTDDTMAQLSDPATMATYQTVATNFTLTINVTAPASGATKAVSVGITPVTGSHDGCVGLASPQTLTFDAAGTATSTHTLVDWPLGFTTADHRCQYSVDWSDTEVLAPGTAPSLAISPEDSILVVGRGVATATGSYLDRTVYVPVITITVPPVVVDGGTTSLFEGTAFEVVFTKKASLDPNLNCSDTLRLNYVVDANGDVAPTSRPVLTDVPGGATDHCEYTVSFPPGATSDPSAAVSWELAAQDTSDGDVTESALTFTRRYALTSAVTFTPDVTITVPDVEASPSNSAFAGATFSVEFARESGPTMGCETVTGSYTVGADGTVSGVAPTLVNVPADGTDPCVYSLTFADPVASPGGALNLATFSPATVRASANAVAASYQTEFTPAVTIDVPQYERDGAAGTNYYEGATFAVGIAPAASANAGCAVPAATVNYEVGAAGTVSPTGGAPSLPDVLAGLGIADRCAYTLTFPDPVSSAAGATPAWTLNRDGAAAGDVSATATAITRGYTASLINFSPNVVVNVPFIDADSDDANDRAGRTITVAYTLAVTDPPQHATCTQTPAALTETYTVGAASRAAPDDALSQVTVGTAQTLVDRPAGQDVRCVYEVEVTLDAELESELPVSSVSVSQIDGGTPVEATYSSHRMQLPLLIDTAGIAARARTVVIERSPPIGEDLVGFVLTEAEEVPIAVSLTLPEFEFAPDAAIEMLLNSPGVCGSDMEAFGGVPASIGLAYAVGAQSGEAVEVVGDGAHTLAAFAQRGDEQRPCVLRVTVLSAPEGCTLPDASTDDDGRSYIEASWAEGAETLAVSPTFTCG